MSGKLPLGKRSYRRMVPDLFEEPYNADAHLVTDRRSDEHEMKWMTDSQAEWYLEQEPLTVSFSEDNLFAPTGFIAINHALQPNFEQV
ncbi:hypothetical protein LZ31DRAFT_601570 [Colletotrichum somersetense]|nr:hypothetical protein LZ31DRAFT_601570 [Colletotrichum somersetense]